MTYTDDDLWEYQQEMYDYYNSDIDEDDEGENGLSDAERNK